MLFRDTCTGGKKPLGKYRILVTYGRIGNVMIREEYMGDFKDSGNVL